MPRKGENIFKRKDGRWEGRYIKGRSPEGKALYGYVYARSYGDVKRKLCTAIACQYKEPKEPKKVQPLFLREQSQFTPVAQDWLESTRAKVKESTYARYRNLMKSYVIPEFGSVNIADLTAESISAHCDHLCACGGIRNAGLSPKTVADVLSVVRRVLRYAQQKGITVACTGNEVTVKQNTRELTVLNRTEQIRLYQYLVENPTERNLGLLICLLMGLRIGEICALRWEDVSLEKGTIHIHQTMQRIQVESGSKKTAVVVTAPKSACSIRTIPIPECILRAILDHFPNRFGYILAGKNGKRVEPRTMQNHFKRVLSAAGIEPVNYHALRHTFATRCVEVGFDVKSLSEILGHANVTITMNRYVHPTMELKKENMQRLSDAFLAK